MSFPDQVDAQEMRILKKEWKVASVDQAYSEAFEEEWVNNSTTASAYTLYTVPRPMSGAANNPWGLDSTNSSTAYYPIDHTTWSVIRYPVRIIFKKGYVTQAIYRRGGRGHPWKKL